MAVLSIIIPVYNTEKYLRECLDSVISQTLQEIEVICVNDGSTDGSLAILQEYAKFDKRIVLIDQENKGLVETRRVGIRHATSDIIGFVDSDDWIESEMFQYMYEKMVSNSLDIVSTGIIKNTGIVLDGLPVGIYHSNEELKVFFSEMIMKKIDGIRGFCPNTVTKLYRKEALIDAIKNIDNRIRNYEDDCLVYSYVLQCKKIEITDKAFYHHRMVDTSMSSKPDPLYWECINYFYLFLKKLFVMSPYRDILCLQLDIYMVRAVVNGLNGLAGLQIVSRVNVQTPFTALMYVNRIIIYGAGANGKKIKKQIEELGRKIEIVAFIDNFCKDDLVEGIPVITNDELMSSHLEYDLIIISIENKDIKEDIRMRLINEGIEREKVIFI